MMKRFNYFPNKQQEKQLDYFKSLVSAAKERSIKISVYGGYGLDGLLGQLTRSHHDFDLLVKVKDRPKLKKLLLDLGYYFERENASKEVFKHNKLGDEFQVEINKQNRLDEFLRVGEANIFPENENALLGNISFKAPTLKGHEHIYRMQEKRAKERGWKSVYRHKDHTETLKEIIRKG